MNELPITGLFRAVARARSMKLNVLRTVVKANVNPALDVAEYERAERDLLERIMDGRIKMEAPPRQRHTKTA
jgi:hypothetical protein